MGPYYENMPPSIASCLAHLGVEMILHQLSTDDQVQVMAGYLFRQIRTGKEGLSPEMAAKLTKAFNALMEAE